MSVTAFRLPASQLFAAIPEAGTISPPAMSHEAFGDRRMSSVNEGLNAPTTLLLRKLPKTTSPEAVRTMLLFAKDLEDTEIVPNDYDEDKGFTTAVARFSTMSGASEARDMLHGKLNTTGQPMIVDIISSSGFAGGMRRNTIDPPSTRGIPQTVSPPVKSSRFNGTFQSIEKLSPPHVSSPPETASSDSSSNLQTIFSPHSPNSNTLKDRSRVTGKSMIGEDGGDDETDGLLKDPLAYMRNDKSGLTPPGRRPNNPRMPVSAFNALSLNTSLNGPSPGSYASPRSAVPQSPFSPGGGPYHMAGNQYLRHNYPPVNPADQNPPCNTLYVGNLPMDTSEDELKAMFSKQRGYKRLCFRTKQNGPMCFVEFEDVSFATKALNELYGVSLHNSVKGGIRLSFSKNPLGVRSGQPGSNTNPSTPLTATGNSMINGLTALSPGGFTTANGPPPGLSAPPGLNGGHTVGSPLMSSQFVGQGLGVGGASGHAIRGMPPNSTSGPASMGSSYPDYMMGR